MTKPSGHSRREFLRGKPDPNTNDRAESETGKLPERGWETSDCVQYFSHRAMACDFEIYFNDGQYPLASDAALECFELIDRVESQLSVYQSQSEISQFNSLPAGEYFELDRDVLDVLRLGRKLTEETGGAFDMTAAVLSELWGFSRRQGKMPEAAEIDSVLEYIGNAGWAIAEQSAGAEQSHRIEKKKNGVQLNLGAIGKGYALDLCRQVMNSHGIGDYLIHGGNSSVLASGNRTNERPEKGWWVNVTHPVLSEKSVAELLISDRALATSGTRRQGFVNRGKWYGHIIDPRTGYPGDQVLSCTVLAPDAATADALATAFYVMGLNATREFCESRKDLSVLMVIAGAKKGFAVETIHLNESEA